MVDQILHSAAINCSLSARLLLKSAENITGEEGKWFAFCLHRGSGSSADVIRNGRLDRRNGLQAQISSVRLEHPRNHILWSTLTESDTMWTGERWCLINAFFLRDFIRPYILECGRLEVGKSRARWECMHACMHTLGRQADTLQRLSLMRAGTGAFDFQWAPGFRCWTVEKIFSCLR